MVIHRMEMCLKLFNLAVEFIVAVAEAVRCVLRGDAFTIITSFHNHSVHLPVVGFLP
ncbi:hypothetical protein ACHQM5_023405 [Ranunculus cassubicifolius]